MKSIQRGFLLALMTISAHAGTVTIHTFVHFPGTMPS